MVSEGKENLLAGLIVAVGHTRDAVDNDKIAGSRRGRVHFEFFEFLGPRGHSPVRKTREGADQVRRRAIDENFQLEVVRFRDGRKTLPSGQNQEGKRGH